MAMALPEGAGCIKNLRCCQVALEATSKKVDALKKIFSDPPEEEDQVLTNDEGFCPCTAKCCYRALVARHKVTEILKKIDANPPEEKQRKARMAAGEHLPGGTISINQWKYCNNILMASKEAILIYENVLNFREEENRGEQQGPDEEAIAMADIKDEVTTVAAETISRSD